MGVAFEGVPHTDAEESQTLVSHLVLSGLKLQPGPTPLVSQHHEKLASCTQIAGVSQQDRRKQPVPWGTIYSQVFLHLLFTM